MGGGGGGLKGEKPKVTDYYAAIAYGLCVGPIDYCSGIQIDEKYVFPSVEANGMTSTTDVVQPDGTVLHVAGDWVSFAAMTSTQVVNADLPDLFGGDEAQGGISGEIYVMFGDAAQVMPDAIQSWQGGAAMTNIFGGVSVYPGVWGGPFGPPGWWGGGGGVTQPPQSTCPGYRNVTTVWFQKGYEGFMWSTNNPMIRKSWFTVTRLPKTGSLGNSWRNIAAVPIKRTRKHTIYEQGESPDTQEVTDMYVAGPDVNPAHIIYELLVDDDFGLGVDPSDIDVLSFQQAAQVLFTEKLGLSFCWKEQQQVHKFIEDVESHADGKLFTNPMTGLLTFRLVREPPQTMIDAAPRLTPDNSVIMSFQRKAWSDLPNELIVSWTNAYTEKKETTVVHNLANLAIQGRTVSDNRNFYGARNPDLAARLGTRELRAVSVPLVSAEVEVDASAWAIVPTDIVVLHWPEYGVEGVVFRVIRVNYGNSASSKVRLSLIEDVFSLAIGDYYTPPTSDHDSHQNIPADIPFKMAMTAPAFFVQRLGALEALDTDDAYMAVISSQGSSDPRPSRLMVQQSDVLGNVSWVGAGDIDTLPRNVIPQALTLEGASFVVSLGPTLPGSAVPMARLNAPPPYAGMFGVIGTTDFNQEIVFVQKVDYDASTGQPTGFYLLRGCLDTVPKAWPAATPVTWFEYDDAVFVRTPVAVGASPLVRLLSVTSLGTLALNAASTFTATADHRPHRPIRPANVVLTAAVTTSVKAALGDAWTGDGVKVASPPVAPLDTSGRLLLAIPAGGWAPAGAAFTISWSNRNRLLEDSRVLRWTDASVPAENGQSVQVTITKTSDGSTLFETEVLTGSSYTVQTAMLQGETDVLVRIRTLDYDDLPSLQSITARVTLGA